MVSERFESARTSERGARTNALSREAVELRERVEASLREQGFRLAGGSLLATPPRDKQQIRQLHEQARHARIERARRGLQRHEPRLLRYFARGDEVEPERVRPRLVQVDSGTEEELLFRYARLHWSIPVSAGYGRRLRFLIIDGANEKLIGLFGLGDPVFHLRPRDRWIGWDETAHRARLRHVMDAFGIPFVGFPVEKRKRPKVKGWTGTSTPIAPDPKKAKYAVELPNVRAWAVGVTKPLVESISVAALPKLVIDPGQTPADVTVKPVVGGKPEEVLSLEGFRAEWPLVRCKMELAKELTERVSTEQDGLLVGPTFEEVLEFVSRYVDERVSAKGSSRKQDIGIYMWRQQALDALQTAVQDAPMDTTTIPIFDEPRLLKTESVPEFKWPGVVAEGKRCHWSSVPCHTDLEADFSRFLDSAKDVVKYVKNERLGFSITYYENNRPRQYFPDFAVELKDGSWWLVETKGEIRPNTAIKKEAADLWCDRMTRAGQGTWRHLFVQEKAFKKAAAAGVSSFGELADRLLREDIPSRRILELIAVDDARVATERFKTLLPVYSLEAAAGYFGEGKSVELEGWMEVTGFKKLTEDMFVARAVGRSMEPRIRDGDYLVFRASPRGTRQGKIVLASGPIIDPELGGSFTVKEYRSEKRRDPSGGWRHDRIILRPLNPDFEPIEISTGSVEGSDVKVVAELVGPAR